MNNNSAAHINSKWIKYFVILAGILLICGSTLLLYRSKGLKEKIPFLSKIFFKYDEYVLKENIAREPHNSHWYYELARLYLEKGLTSKIEEVIKEARNIDPYAFAQLNSMASEFEEKHQFERALELYEIGAKLDKEYKSPFYDGIGRMYYNLAQLGRLPQSIDGYGEAIKAYEEALRHIESYDIKGKENLRRDIEEQINKIKNKRKK